MQATFYEFETGPEGKPSLDTDLGTKQAEIAVTILD
jgi:hypothetical protein